MSVETLIYAYLAICSSMIVFNIVCIYVFYRKDMNLKKRSRHFEEEVRKEIELENVRDEHKAYLMKKLIKVNYLMAFDEMLEAMIQEEEKKTKQYIESLSSVFIYLTEEYHKKNQLQAAYFPYLINKYHLFRNQHHEVVADVLLELVKEENLYCRENALQALYSIGNSAEIIKALKIINSNTYYHNQKLITDGLLEFAGDHHELADKLWPLIDRFRIDLRLAILNYFRFHSGEYKEKMLALMLEQNQDPEVVYSCIRYFGKYHYELAYPYLLEYAKNKDEKYWEKIAITCSALAIYPKEETIEILKEKLCSRNWYVRSNASKSLELLGLTYVDLIDIFEGKDRYAAEILRYRFDQKKMIEKEKNRV